MLQRLINKIKSLIGAFFIFRPKSNAIFKLEAGHEVRKAFTLRGIDYYEFADNLNIPTERAFAAMAILEEFELRCSKEYLSAALEAVSLALARADIQKALFYIEQIKLRKDWIVEPETILKLASVRYFSADENPYAWDMGLATEKIANWQKDKKVLSFFLQGPLKDLLILSKDEIKDLPVYLSLGTKQAAQTWMQILEELCMQQGSDSRKNYGASQITTYTNWLDSEK